MSDGRFIHPELGLLTGEAAGQDNPKTLEPTLKQPWQQVPGAELETYFDQRLLQKPVWIWSVPAYFYVGGTAGGALALASAAQWADARGNRKLIRHCRWIGTLGLAAGAVFLILDLGRPARFLNMLRVFRPTSPLSLGSWLLTAAGPLAGGAALGPYLGGPFRRLGDLAGHAAGVLGMPLAGYTGVVLTNSAIPAWQNARRAIPVLFVASAMAGTASLLEFSGLSRREERAVSRFGIIGKAVELGATFAVEKELARVPRALQSYRRGRAGLLWKLARVCSAASLLLSLLPGRSKPKRIATGVLGTAGAVLIRFGAMQAGKVNALDPRAVSQEQRTGLGGAEITGRAAVTAAQPPPALPAPERVRTAGPGIQ